MHVCSTVNMTNIVYIGSDILATEEFREGYDIIHWIIVKFHLWK